MKGRTVWGWNPQVRISISLSMVGPSEQPRPLDGCRDTNEVRGAAI